MAEQLRITTPITTNDSINKAKPNKEPNVVESLQPNVVAPKVNSQQAEDKESPYFSWKNGSVFQKFLSRLSQIPELSQSLQKLLLGSMEQPIAYSGVSTTLQSVFSKLHESITMDEQQMLENLMFQQDNSTKFSGQLFEMLNELIFQNKSPELNEYVGRFLKAYDGFSSLTDTMNLIMLQLKDILRSLPKSYRQEIEKSMNQLQVLNSEKGLENNLKTLKQEIVPLLGKYVASTNDYGKVRDKISMLVHNISRLNISSTGELTNRFQELLDFLRFQLNMPAKELSKLQQLYIQKLTLPEKTENEFVQSLLDALSCTKSQNISNTSKTILSDTMNALLMDNSVYMPFTHLYLPALFDDAFLLSDIWIEKNDNQKDGIGEASQEKRLHLEFDIRGLGSFQALVILKNNDISFQIHYPEQLRSKDDQIRKKITNIFAENGFNSKILTSTKSLDVKDELLRKVLEKKGVVNVVV